MEDKKMAPPPQHQQNRIAQQYVQHREQQIPQGEMQYVQSNHYPQTGVNIQQQNQPNGIVHQAPPNRGYAQPPGLRSPLLENHQELYGTKQQDDLSRHYALREQRNEQLQQRSIPLANSTYSIPSPSRDPILSAPVPLGFNASVHQAYLRRNQHQLDQIYQNHQNVYTPTGQPKIYQSYSTRMHQPSYLSSGHSHTQLLRQQYNELQQMKIQQQIQYQNQAQLQQQQTFAQRQILHQHLHSRQQSQQNLNQYDSSVNIYQKEGQNNEVNSRLMNKSDITPTSSDYAFSPDKSMQNHSRYTPQSPTTVATSINNKASGELAGSPSSKSPSGSESRRSSTGTTQALRSPIAQRPLSAPVTMAGWLYKQGSDGLKVWRKRWFVLTEYCLFYYKGQEEEKLLGSILLPSYQVSLCSADDKVMRKFAFKCEHTNMRTYILAAPDRDQMNQWVKALTMSALMQEGNNAYNQSKVYQSPPNEENSNRIMNNNIDQDEITPEICGGIQPMYENAPPKPRRSNEGYNSPSPEKSMERYDPKYDISTRDVLNNSRIELRSNSHNNAASPMENIYQSKSASSNYDVQSNPRSPESIYNTQNARLPVQNHPSQRPDSKSPYNFQTNINKTYEETENRLSQSPTYNDNQSLKYQQEEQQNYKYQTDGRNSVHESSHRKLVQHNYNDREYEHNYQQHPTNEKQTLERRTPDTYGRSVVMPGYYSKGRSSDYEDVYNNPQINTADQQNYGDVMYRRPLSPVSYEEKLAMLQNPHQRFSSSTNDNQSYQKQSGYVRHKKLTQNNSTPILPSNTVPRPHSADFLEYESKNPVYDPNVSNRYASNASRQPPRPKSSLDINHYDYNGDSQYYSEASYAEKMRQSSHYLRSKGSGASVANLRQTKMLPSEYTKQRKMSAPNFLHADGNGEGYGDRSPREPIYGMRDQNKNIKGLPENSGLGSNWTLRNKNLSHVVSQDDVYNRSNSALSEGSTASYMKEQIRDCDAEQFIRSASARLPASSDQNGMIDGEGKAQQREESMKRLLEWKQRMLQSPLTRKSTPATLSLARSLNQTKSINPYTPTDRYLNVSGGQTFPKTRSSNPHAAYNSYSSDDEERLADVVRGEPSMAARREQAGRSLTPPPQSTTPVVPSNVTRLLDPNSDASPACSRPSDDTPLSQTSDLETSQEPQIANDETKDDDQLEYTDADLDEVLALYEDSEVGESKKSAFQSTDANEPFGDYEICEINQSDKPEIKRAKALTPPSTPVNPDICENHYLPMSPRKVTISESENILNETKKNELHHHEDNPYVEMSQGIGIESAFMNEEMQAYEVVCVATSKTEPVYMELSAPEKSVLKDDSVQEKKNVPKSILRKQASDSKLPMRTDVKSPLPDILNNSVLTKSDDSDADDEASKDFSLDTAYSRFSLSDNFRPASYYLQTKGIIEQDSSDSEIISPPPIPKTLPPVDAIEEIKMHDESVLSERKSTSLMVYGNTPSMYDTIFKGERAKRNRSSLPENEPFHTNKSSLSLKSIPPSYKMSGDSDSLLSYNADRGSSRMSIESDISSKYDIPTPMDSFYGDKSNLNATSDISSVDIGEDFVELRHTHASDADIERMLKRRPLSDESCFEEVEAFDNDLNQMPQNSDFDKYLDELQSGNIIPPPQSMYHSKIYEDDAILREYPLDKATVGYLNDRVAAIREEAQYENIILNEKLRERNRSRNSNMSNSTSEPDTVSTFQTVYSPSNASTRESPFRLSFESSTPARSASRSSLPLTTENVSNQSLNHTRHASFEQPTISYYSKNACQDGNDSILKNLNKSANSDESKVTISEVTLMNVSKSVEGLNVSDSYNKSLNISHQRENSAEQSAPYYYSDLSSQDNLNTICSAAHTYNKNSFVISNKLNNQRRKAPVLKKCDISHIHNPIHSYSANNGNFAPEDGPNLIAAAARCVSVEFLSAADKIADIDNKNIYESSALKQRKGHEMSSKNIYPSGHDKTNYNQNFGDHREHEKSLDQIIHIMNPSLNRSINMVQNDTSNMSNQDESPNTSRISNSFERKSPASVKKRNARDKADKPVCEGESMWDEDRLWSENLRRVSHRHARSLDHLDCLANQGTLSGRRSVDLKTMLTSVENVPSDSKHKSVKLSREVTYVNDNVKSQRSAPSKRKYYKKHKSAQKMTDLTDENDVYVQLALNPEAEEPNQCDDGVYEQLAMNNRFEENQFFLCEDKSEGKEKFEIDRENLRQWDLMSSGLLKNDGSTCTGVSSQGGGAAEGEGMHSTSATSASISIIGNEMMSKGSSYNLTSKKSFTGSNPSLSRTSSRDINIPVRAVSPRVRSNSVQPWIEHNESWSNNTSSQTLTADDNWSVIRSPSRQSNQPIRAVSPRVRRASDVEERNQVRPTSPGIYDPLLGIQNFSAGELLGRTHEELVLLLIQLRRKHTATANAIEQCCSQINSVQNRINCNDYFEQKQENLQRLEQLKHHLMELEKHYEKSKPLVHLVDNMVKLGTLYNRPGGSVPSTLDRLEYNQMIRDKVLMEQAAEQRRWAESSENLPREHIERKVEELRAMERWIANESNTIRGLRREREAQQGGPALQQDLSRVHAMLAENSKKLEQTVAGNARLEQELNILKQKLQQQSNNQYHMQNGGMSSDNGIDTRAAADATALLEDELRRVQQLVGDLQKQRQELSIAVRHLTDKSQTMGIASPNSTMQMRQSYSNDFHSNGMKESGSKNRHNTIWTETDLDTNSFIEHGSPSLNMSSCKKYTPLYIDTQPNTSYLSDNKDNMMSPLSDEINSSNPFNNLSNVEKQEIKTVRIVKRESERRQRDRERSLGNNDWANQQPGTLDQLLEEENNITTYRFTSLPRSNQNYNQSQPKLNVNDPSMDYKYKTQTTPPNTLSLTNVNIPFDTKTSMNYNNKFLSNPSLNNNEYAQISSKYGYTNHSSYSKTNHVDNGADKNYSMLNGHLSPETSKHSSVTSLTKGTSELSPVFTSETAKQIIIEMAEEKNGFVKHSNGSQHRRQVPKEKRRHYTAPQHLLAKDIEKTLDNDMFYNEKWWRARDDVDMERVLRGGLTGSKHGPPPLIAPPDVVRSTLPSGHVPDHYSESTIDRLLAAPNKIIIPERYVPEQAPELSPEEQKKRLEKVESIKKMLTCSTTPSSDPNKVQSPDSEDKRQREHLLQLNQLLAKQVMEKSKIVAGTGADLQPLPPPSATNQKS